MQCFVEFHHSVLKDIEWTDKGDVCSFVLLYNAPVNSYGHVETVSSSNHTLFPWTDRRDQCADPWICSQTRICNQTRYRLSYAARYTEVRSYAPYPHPLLKWPKTADDKRVYRLPIRPVYLLIFTRMSMIEKIENNREGYFLSNSAPIDQTSTMHHNSACRQAGRQVGK